MDRVEITSLSELDAAFGDLGTNVGPRTGPNKRTQEAKEWFVLRHFISAAVRAQMFEPPIAISRTEPPAPDFTVGLGIAGEDALIEITEATHPDDQREMTEFEKSGKSLMLLGDFGGRFADGVSQPKLAWASEILDAILRKRDKSICTSHASDRHLVIYPNSSASQLLFDAADEREAFAHLRQRLETERAGYSEALNGCRVHVVGKMLVGFDLTGTFSLKVRDPRGFPATAQNATNDNARAD